MNTLSSLLSFIGSFEPVGSVKMYAGSNAPSKWLFCQGQAVSRNTYAKLFDVIGTTYGSGDGVNTFNLPDFQGRTAIGAGTGTASGATAHSLGQQEGSETVLLSDQQMAHGHGMTQPAFTIAKEGMTSTGMSANETHTHNFTNYIDITPPGGSTRTPTAYGASQNLGGTSIKSTSVAHTHKVPSAAYSVPRTTDASVSNLYGASSTRTAHNNMQPYTAINYIIFAGK